MYKRVDLKVLGIPSRVSSEFLSSLREENPITSKGEHEKDYILEVSDVNDRMYYLNHGKGPNWI